jgi:hypothetical protein
MRKLIERYREAFRDPGFWRSTALSIIVFLAGLEANLFAIKYATESASNSVSDIVLSNIPVFDVDGLFVYGTLVFVVFSIIVVLVRPKRVPFALLAVGLFWIIRSAFTSLTHLAPFEAHYQSSFGPGINNIFFGGDTFFSGHTGMPFLGVLGFWRHKYLPWLFLAGSLFFGTVVLLGHLHYSIDVASAFFITYGIFDIAKWLFPKSLGLFYEA